jgi:hypothetical protein
MVVYKRGRWPPTALVSPTALATGLRAGRVILLRLLPPVSPTSRGSAQADPANPGPGMALPKFIEIDGNRILWTDGLKLRREQEASQARQLPLPLSLSSGRMRGRLRSARPQDGSWSRPRSATFWTGPGISNLYLAAVRAATAGPPGTAPSTAPPHPRLPEGWRALANRTSAPTRVH